MISKHIFVDTSNIFKQAWAHFFPHYEMASLISNIILFTMINLFAHSLMFSSIAMYH